MLGLLQSLYKEVIVTDSVFAELDSEKDNTLSSVKAAIQQGWLDIVVVPIDDQEIANILDPGEASAISYSLQHNRIPLLIDEHKGKRYARSQGIPVIGTAGVLILAKQKNLIPLVKPLLLNMKEKGYWLSDQFIDTVTAIAGE